MNWQAIVFSGVGMAVIAALGFLINYLLKLAATKKWAGAMASLVEILKSAIAHAESELAPEIAKIYEDGTMSPAEWVGLKSKIIVLAKGFVKDGLAGIMKALGIQGSAVETFLSGVIEQLVKAPAAPVQLVSAPPK